MDDAALVGHLHGARQRLHELGSRPRIRRALADPLVEAASLDILERKERPAFVLAGLENLHDIGMKQLGDGFRLGSKPRQAHLADMRSRQNHLRARPGAAAGDAGPCRRRPCPPGRVLPGCRSPERSRPPECSALGNDHPGCHRLMGAGCDRAVPACPESGPARKLHVSLESLSPSRSRPAPNQRDRTRRPPRPRLKRTLSRRWSTSP